MESRNVTLTLDKAKEFYNSGNAALREVALQAFTVEELKFSNFREIKTFEDALTILGNDNQTVIDYFAISRTRCTNDIFAFAKLRVIATALNEGWEPTFDKDEWRYYPWFYIYTQKEYEELDEDEKKSCRVPLRSGIYANASGGLVFAHAVNAGSNSLSYIGVRLAFKTRELAEYCGKQFIDIWADFLLA